MKCSRHGRSNNEFWQKVVKNREHIAVPRGRDLTPADNIHCQEERDELQLRLTAASSVVQEAQTEVHWGS